VGKGDSFAEGAGAERSRRYVVPAPTTAPPNPKIMEANSTATTSVGVERRDSIEATSRSRSV
jgi:hypothetical protein